MKNDKDMIFFIYEKSFCKMISMSNTPTNKATITAKRTLFFMIVHSVII